MPFVVKAARMQLLVGVVVVVFPDILLEPPDETAPGGMTKDRARSIIPAATSISRKAAIIVLVHPLQLVLPASAAAAGLLVHMTTFIMVLPVVVVFVVGSMRGSPVCRRLSRWWCLKQWIVPSACVMMVVWFVEGRSSEIERSVVRSGGGATEI
jgi:hypothetical protein